MQYSLPSVDEFVDLDSFLDSYLTGLHNDRPGAAGATGLGSGLPGSIAMQSGMAGAQGPMSGISGLGSLVPPMQAAGPSTAMAFEPSTAAATGQGSLNQLPPSLQGSLGAVMAGLQGPMQTGMPNSGLAGLNGVSRFNMGLANSLGMPNLVGLMALQQQQQQLSGMQGAAGAAQPSTTQLTAGGARGGVSKAVGRGRGTGRAGKIGRAKSDVGDHLSDSDHNSSGTGDSDGGGNDEHKPRKKQLTTDEAERRHLALQEKNRRAQRRFRERQKNKLTDLHRQIEELTTRVSSLQNENAALHSRTSILEKVLDMRNEQIQVMQETKESTQYPGGEEELLQLQDVGGQLVQLSPEMIKELSSDQIYKIYQMYVKELSTQLNEGHPALTNGSEGSGTLQSVSSDQSIPTSPGLEKLVKDLSLMIMRLGVIKPLETRKFIVVSRQYLGSSEAEVIELWKNVMRAIDLSDQQKREVVELKRMFLQKIEPIMEERKHLNVQIQANLPHDTFHTKNALTYIKAHEAVIKLRNNLRAEQHVVLEFAIAVFRGVFRPRQMATLLVKCYPAVPDALGIASALAAELGEPESPATRALAVQLGGYIGQLWQC